MRRTLKAGTVLAATALTSATTIALTPSLAGASSTECGATSQNGSYNPVLYCTQVNGSGAFISSFGLWWGWEGGGVAVYNGYDGHVLYSKGCSGEPCGSLQVNSQEFDMGAQQPYPGPLDVTVNWNAVDHEPYCGFIYKDVGTNHYLLNGGNGVPACVTLD